MAGPILCAAVLLLAWLTKGGGSWAQAADGLRALSVLATVVSGLFSAVWWYQSAEIGEGPDAMRLSASAATLTALALIAGVFSGLPWPGTEAELAAAAFLALLAISGRELAGAAALSAGRPLQLRTVLAVIVMLAALLLFFTHHVRL